ncbi:uncharacterized protein LOC111300944 [Durio zibethinus]|uniref:Uncharacterized protein LOC111300944 n=1 Tax=Durio zibethinus TaxID=66656 RepID=A0A6P5ZHM8_DURZI|nr:uncharacterized protein LOC111300944 [Durio zibethinus]
MTLFYYNKATISIAKNLVYHDRTKHIELNRHFIKEKIEKLAYIPTSSQIANILTKALPRSIFDILKSKMRVNSAHAFIKSVFLTYSESGNPALKEKLQQSSDRCMVQDPASASECQTLSGSIYVANYHIITTSTPKVKLHTKLNLINAEQDYKALSSLLGQIKGFINLDVIADKRHNDDID